MATTKVKVEVERPVYAAVEQTSRPMMDRYRVVLFKNVKNGTITIDKIEYKVVTEGVGEPSVNAHAFRVFCDTKNGERRQEQEKLIAQRKQENDAKMAANREQAEKKRKADRHARWVERRQGEKRAAVILPRIQKEQKIRSAMLDEVETGERKLPVGARSLISRGVV